MSYQGQRLVYGLIPHQSSLVFLPEPEAIGLAKELSEILSLKTVGEARAYRPSYTEVPDLESLDDDEALDGDAYSAIDSEAHADGDWPKMVTQRALESLPAAVSSAVGQQVDTVLNGTYLEIPPASEKEVIAKLETFGFVCRRDDELILRCELVHESDISEALGRLRTDRQD